MAAPEFDEVSENAKDLIQHMIAPLEKRYNSEQVLQHPWAIQVRNNDLLLQLNLI